MKKVISLFLAMILAFSALSVCASAVDGEFQTYYIQFDIDEDTIHVVPVDGYTQYVLPGEDFKFTVETDEDYSDTFIIVQLDTVTIEPDIHGVYTIPEVTQDHTVKIFLSMKEEQSNLFASIIVLVHNLFQYIVDMLNSLFKGMAT